MGVAHSSCMGIAEEPSVASTIQTRVWARVGTEIAASSALLACYNPRGNKINEHRTHILPAFQLSGTVKLTLV